MRGRLRWGRPRPCVLILLYHRVCDRSDFLPESLRVGVREFERQMRFFQRRFTPIPLEGALGWVRAGTDRPDAFAVTFDDGFKDVYQNAFPILKRYAIPATLFRTHGFRPGGGLHPLHRFYWLLARAHADDVLHALKRSLPITAGRVPGRSEQRRAAALRSVLRGAEVVARRRAIEALLGESLSSSTGRAFLARLEERAGAGTECPSGNDYYMDDEELLEMMRSGLLRCGGHSVSHTALASLPPDSQRREILGSVEPLRRLAADQGKRLSRFFAYPYGGGGSYNEDTVRILREEGFQGGLTTRRGFLDPQSDAYALPRYDVNGRSLPRLALQVAGVRHAFTALWEVCG